MIKQESPRAGQQRGLNEGYLPRCIIEDRIPKCKLSGCRIVGALPVGCPLGAENPLEAVHTFTERGFGRLFARPTPDNSGGLDDLDRADTCGLCIHRLLGHPRIRRLRQQLSEETARATNESGGIRSRRVGRGRL